MLKKTNDIQLDTLRLPPHSVEAEQFVLGSLLRDNNAWALICDRVDAQDFYHQGHRLIFQAIAMLINSGKPADVSTVNKKLGQLDCERDGLELEYLDSMARGSASTANIARYADIVRDRCVLRELITAVNAICENAYQTQDEDIAALLEKAEAKILAIAGTRVKGIDNLRSLPLVEVVEELDAFYASDDSALVGAC